jgi:tetratricopeptide (TPR) repeat protein
VLTIQFKIKLIVSAVLFLMPVFSVAIAQIPGHPTTEREYSSRQKAEMLAAQGKYEEAIGIWKSLLEKGESDSELFRGLVIAHDGAGQMEKAEEFLTGYLESNPGHSPALYGLGYINYLINKHLKAEEYLKKAVEADPENALAWNNWGAVKTRTKSYTIAVDMVQKAIHLNPDNLLFYNNLMVIYRQMGSYGLFFAEFEDYVKKGPDIIAFGYGKVLSRDLRQQGFKLYAQGKLDDSIKRFQDMVDIYRKINYLPGLVPGLFSLGLLFEEKGELDAARKYFDEVLKINPDHIQARDKVKGG